MEIGSIFEIDPATVKRGSQTAALHLPQVDKYGKNQCCFTASGREAIELALISLERERPDTRKCCLLPAYMCDSVFLPFLHRGWELVFYSVDRELESAGEEIFRLALAHDPGLIFIHPYYGTDTCAGLRRQMSALRRSGVLVMEDVTQSYYLEEAGKDVDFVVGSLRKWYAVPGGGGRTGNGRRVCQRTAGSPRSEMGVPAGKREKDRGSADGGVAPEKVGVSEKEPLSGECP